MEKVENQASRVGKWVKESISARMLMIGVLILVLLIPLSYVKDLIRERKYRQKEVIGEINQKWGGEVLLYGPILKIPYKTYSVKKIYNPETKSHQEETITHINYGYFFPKKLDIQTTVNPQQKKRGIYETAVYESEINLKGSFTKPDFSEVDIKEEDILWEKSRLIIETSNFKGVSSLVEINLHKNTYAFESKYDGKRSMSRGKVYENSANDYSYVGLHKLESKSIKKADLPVSSDVSFSLKMNVNGSKQIRFIPIGKETSVNIKSNWKTANFLGEYLPYNPDKIKDDGFDAKWKVLDINRPFPQQSFSGTLNLKEYAFGVNFMIPVDQYQKSERTTKYGFLVIGLTFLVFFLIQTMSKILIHPFQYLMIGIALVMFYTLLISISEHSNFLSAYLIASTAVILLISLYSKSILKVLNFPLFIGSSLTILYTFIFVIIQLENYALLVGSVGLFVILASVMYTSRKIDWQNG